MAGPWTGTEMSNAEDHLPVFPTKTITQSELNRLCQQLQDLREALRPFANFAECLKDSIPDETIAFLFAREPGARFVTAGQIRTALALLKRLEEEDATRHITDAEEKMAAVACTYCQELFVPDDATRANELPDGRQCCSEKCYSAAQKIDELIGPPKRTL